MTFTETTELTYITHVCPTCGVYYALEGEYRRRRKEYGDSWHCPNGHKVMFTESDADRLKKELDERNKANANLHEELYQKNLEIKKLHNATKRRNKRISAGVCPCCNRTFKQLAAHMKSKHPEVLNSKEQSKLHKKISKKKAGE